MAIIDIGIHHVCSIVFKHSCAMIYIIFCDFRKNIINKMIFDCVPIMIFLNNYQIYFQPFQHHGLTILITSFYKKY